MFYGSLVHSLSLTEIEYLENALLGVDEYGVIAFLDKAVSSTADVDQLLEAHGWSRQDTLVVEMKRGEFLVPGWVNDGGNHYLKSTDKGADPAVLPG